MRFLLALALIFWPQNPQGNSTGHTSGGGGPTITVVQHKINDNGGSGTTASVTMGAGLTIGNDIVVGTCGAGTAISSVSDNGTTGGNTYASRGSVSGTFEAHGFDSINITKTATIVTANLASNNFGCIQVWEVHRSTGHVTYDSTAAFQSVSSGTGVLFTVTGAAITTGNNPSFIAALIIPNDIISVNNIAPFTAGGDIATSGPAGESNVTSSTGTFTPTWTDHTSGDSFTAITWAYF